MKRFVEGKCLALIPSEEPSDNIYSSSCEYRKRFAQNGTGLVPTGMPIDCFIVTFPTLK